MKPRRLFAWAIRIGLAALFGYAGVMKLLDPEAFAREIANYQLVPSLAPHLAAVLPTTECVAALALLLPSAPWRRAGALAVAGLLAVFLVGVVSVVVRGVNIDCGCFGSGSGSVTGLTILRNVALAAAALYLVFEDGWVPSPERRGERVGAAPGVVGRPD